MKTTQKILVATIALVMLTPATFADVKTGTWVKQEKTQYKQEIKGLKETKKAEISTLKEAKKTEVKANLEQRKDNRDSYKEQRKSMTWALKTEVPKEVKDQIKKLADERQAQIKVLQDQIKTSSWITVEQKEAIRLQIKEIQKSFNDKVQALVAQYPNAKALFEEKAKLLETNKTLLEKALETKKVYKDKIEQKKEEYKAKIDTKTKEMLSSLSVEKLQEKSAKIAKLIETYRAKTAFTQEKKDKLVAQLTAIQETIAAEIAKKTSVSN